MSASKSHLHRYDAPAASHRPTNMSELSILLKHHQFIRDEAEDSDIDPSKLSWENKVSLSWYNKLFREYAVCDLTQYKTGGIALRWRTEEEVLQRAGELTCGNLHCKYHEPVESPEDRDEDDNRPLVPCQLTAYQLNFQYHEQGKTKQALVKVVLCSRCATKLTWKKDQEKLTRGEVDKGKGKSTDDIEVDRLDTKLYRSEDVTSAHAARSRSRSPQRQRGSSSKQEVESRRDRASRKEESSSRRGKGVQGNSAPKSRIRTVITSLMGKYYEAILDGSKTWEGRTNTPRYATLRPDDEFIFHHAEDVSKPAFTALILDVQKFDNFSDMLEGRVQEFLPGVETLQEGIQVYENIPGYREQAKEHGATAFRVRVIDRGDTPSRR